MTSVNPSVKGVYPYPSAANTAHKKALHLLNKDFDAIAGKDGYVSPQELESYVGRLHASGGIEAEVSLKLLEAGEKYANAANPFTEQQQGLFPTDINTALTHLSKADLAEMNAKTETSLFSRIFNPSQTVGSLEKQAKDNYATLAKNPQLLNGLIAQTQYQQEATTALSNTILEQLRAEQLNAAAMAEQAIIEQVASALVQEPANAWDAAADTMWSSPETPSYTPSTETPWYNQVEPNSFLIPQNLTDEATASETPHSQGGTTIRAGDNTVINVFDRSPNPVSTVLADGASIQINPDGSVTNTDGTPLTPSSPSTPATGMPSTPATGTPSTPATGTPSTPATGMPSTPATPPARTVREQATNSINAEGDVIVNIYNGTTTVNPTARPSNKPEDTPAVTPKGDPATPPGNTPNTASPKFVINQRANTLSITDGPSIQLVENTVDTLNKEASSTFKTGDNTLGGHMVFASGDDVWAAQNTGVSVVYWDPRPSFKEAGKTPTFKFYAAEPVTIEGKSKQGELTKDEYLAAINSDQLTKLTGMPAPFQSAYDKLLTTTS
jgi:hypothetical protein